MLRAVARVLLSAALLCLASSWAEANDGYRLLELNGRPVKWGSPTFGTGVVLSYAVLGDHDAVSGIRNCTATSGVSPALKHSRLSAHAFDIELRHALALWEGAANVRFRRVGTPGQADIVIGAQAKPDGAAFADIATVTNEFVPTDRIIRGIVCLSPEPIWISGVCLSGRRSDAVAGTDRYCLRYALAHEIGHVLGLDHPGPRGELMSFDDQSGPAALQSGDLTGIVTLYGPRTGGALLASSSRGLSTR